MRVLFCGDRNWTDRKKIDQMIIALKLTKNDLLIEGGAKGADEIAGRMADKRGIPHCIFPANWDFYDRAAGPIRNTWMLKFGQPDLVVAFHPDIKSSKGTADMVARAKKAGIEVRIIE